MCRLGACAVVAAAAVQSVAAFGQSKMKPHVLFILVDDLGHAELGYNRQVKTQEVSASRVQVGVVPPVSRASLHTVRAWQDFQQPRQCARLWSCCNSSAVEYARFDITSVCTGITHGRIHGNGRSHLSSSSFLPLFSPGIRVCKVQTPSIDSLVADGIKMERHYVHKFCSPTRCAIQSGRAPIHVSTPCTRSVISLVRGTARAGVLF